MNERRMNKWMNESRMNKWMNESRMNKWMVGIGVPRSMNVKWLRMDERMINRLETNQTLDSDPTIDMERRGGGGENIQGWSNMVRPKRRKTTVRHRAIVHNTQTHFI